MKRNNFTGVVAAVILMTIASLPCVVFGADTSPPASPVKLVFIHHSTGGNWLADPGTNPLGGGLGIALKNNNYYVSATNYTWGPDNIGDRTDIGNWPEWFIGENRDTVMARVYSETGQNIIGDFENYGPWQRLAPAPGGENQIVMFKSCFPNSYLRGNPQDPPTTGNNPLYGQGYDSEFMTVANAKGIYNDILTYFTSKQDKLFIVITAPPQGAFETDAEHAANARAFNNWLVNDWLKNYPYRNVAVFDFYNVLTSNGGNPDTNDAGQETGNHHRWHNGSVQHIQTLSNNMSSYPSGDSHPSAAGGQKAAAEFVPLLNYFYNLWKQGGTTACPGNINGDDKIDLNDVILALRILAGVDTGTSIIRLCADVNNDGKIGIEELIYILQIVAGLR